MRPNYYVVNAATSQNLELAQEHLEDAERSANCVEVLKHLRAAEKVIQDAQLKHVSDLSSTSEETQAEMAAIMDISPSVLQELFANQRSGWGHD